MARNVPIGIELVKRNIVSEADVKEAIKHQKSHPNKKLVDIIHFLGLCDERELLKALGDILNEKVVLLNNSILKIQPTDYLSLDVCKRCKAVPFEEYNGKVKVCFSDLSNKKAVEQVRLLLLHNGYQMDRYLTVDSNLDSTLESLEGTSTDNLTAVTQDVVKLVDTIIKTAMEKNASDIHIEPMENVIRVRYRVDGNLIVVAKIEKEKQAQIIGRLKAISNMYQEKQEDQDGRILLYPDYNIRVSSQVTIYGEKFVLRLLKKEAKIRDIYELGFPREDNFVRKHFDKRNSITIVAAPTGEGKTTTLYSIINTLNTPDVNIITIEDPVEIRIEGLNQVEVGPKATFASSLRTVLRQDPNIVLVGEIRDLETAEIAMQAGQTGHYVLSTIHTINAIEVITRLRKLGISDYDISSTVATCVSQRLVRRVCPHCAKKREFTQEEKDAMNKLAAPYNIKFDFKDKFTYETVGCKECNNTGYLGRIAIIEILSMTDKIKELIVNGASTYEIRKAALEEGYLPFEIDGLYKVLDGRTTLEELDKKVVLFNR